MVIDEVEVLSVGSWVECLSLYSKSEKRITKFLRDVSGDVFVNVWGTVIG